MTSRAAHALLRAYVAHPFAAFPASAYASTALAAFSATGHALLPNSPPRDSIGRFRGGGYLQVLGDSGEGRMEEAMVHHFVNRVYVAAAGANESNKLRQLILQSLYPSSSDNSVPTDVFLPVKSKVINELRKHLFSGKPFVRSFCSGGEFDKDQQYEQLKRIGDAVEEILKILQDSSANKSSPTSSSTRVESTRAENLKENQEQDTPTTRPTTHPADTLSKIPLLILSCAESFVKALREWLPKEGAAHVALVVLQEAITLAKDPAAKWALDQLMEQRNIKRNIKSKAADGKNKDIVVADSIRARLLGALAVLDKYYTPLLVAEVIAGVVFVLVQISW